MNQVRFRTEESCVSAEEDKLILNVRDLLRAHKINEAELARRAGLPKATLHKILAGSTEDPRISTVQAVASVFNMTVDELYVPNISKMKQHKIEVRPIPIISWSDCFKGASFIENLTPSNWKKWLVIENTKKDLYGLTSKASIESQFPKGTILIIDPKSSPSDGDFVVVKYPDADEATIREVSMDGPVKLLLPINDYSEKEKLTSKIQLLGTVIQSRLDLEY